MPESLNIHFASEQVHKQGRMVAQLFFWKLKYYGSKSFGLSSLNRFAVCTFQRVVLKLGSTNYM